MAYGQAQNASKFGNKSTPVTNSVAKPAGEKRETIYRTGLFTSDKEGSKTLASVKVKEAVTIPAGSYINLYHNTDKKTPEGPDYTITVMPGVVK